MSAHRPMWSERNARRDQIVVLAVAVCIVLGMAVAFVLLAHSWTSGSVPAASR